MEAKEHRYPMEKLQKDLERVLEEGGHRQAVEEKMKAAYQVEGAYLTTSATAGLELALMGLDLAPGDEVLLPGFTFVACATAILRAGGRPVFCDIDPKTFAIDPQEARKKCTQRTRALLVVHYGGVPADLEALKRLGLPIIEDAAHAFGGTWREKPLGTWGDYGVFSFHQTKDLSTGEGGLLLCRDKERADRLRTLYDKGTNRRAFLRGAVDRYTWVDRGSSFMMNDVTALLFSSQLDQVEALRKRREKVAQGYDRGLAHLPLTRQARPEDLVHSHHLYPVLAGSQAERDDLIVFLQEEGIPASFHYVPLSSAPFARKLGVACHLPVTEEVAARLLRLPIHGWMTDDQPRRVLAALEDYFDRL